jgi:NADPH-dependent curcumin reductase CurA
MDDPTSIADTMNTTIHLAKRPKEAIVPGETFEVRRSPIPKKEEVKDGQVLVKVEYLSVDPGLTCADGN